MRLYLGLIWGLAVALQGWWAVEASRYSQDMIRGIRAWQGSQPIRAVGFYDRALGLWGGEAELWLERGEAALYASQTTPGDTEKWLVEAWRSYEAVVRRNPTEGWGWVGLAETALRLAEHYEREVGEDLSSILAAEPRELDADRAVALAAVELARFLKPTDYQAMDVEAAIWQSAGRTERAAACYAESAATMPFISFHRWGQATLFPPPVYERIVQAVQTAGIRTPGFERTMLLVEAARFSARHEDMGRAVALAMQAKQQAVRAYDRFRASYELARVLEKQGRWIEAIRALSEAQEVAPQSASGLERMRGMLELRAGRPGEACEFLRQALRNEREDEQLRITTAEACEQAGYLEVAERILREGFVIPSDAPRTVRALAALYRRHGRLRAAEFWEARLAEDQEKAQ